MLKVTSRRPRDQIKEDQLQQQENLDRIDTKQTSQRVRERERNDRKNIYQLCHYFEKWHSTAVNGFALAHKTQCTTRKIKNFLSAPLYIDYIAQAQSHRSRFPVHHMVSRSFSFPRSVLQCVCLATVIRLYTKIHLDLFFLVLVVHFSIFSRVILLTFAHRFRSYSLTHSTAHITGHSGFDRLAFGRVASAKKCVSCKYFDTWAFQ